MTDAITQYGAAMSIGGTAVAQLDEIGEVKIAHKLLEATAHDSTSGWEELIPSGRKSVSAIPIKGRLKVSDTNGQVALKTALVAGTLSAIVITFPTAITATWSFNAYVEDFSTGALGQDGVAEFTATLRVSGVPTLAITASGGISGLSGIEENAGGALTFNPTFATGTYDYVVAVNTASTYIKLTPTAASHTITISNGTTSQSVTSGAQSGEIDLGAAGTVTTVTITVYETGKAAKVYTIHVSRP